MSFKHGLAALAVIVGAWVVAQPLAAQPFIEGIDVSLFQDTIDWETARSSGIEFAYIRATRGEEYVDPLFLANMRGAAKAGVLAGAYHFCFVDTDVANPQDPVIEADHFLSVIKPYYDAGMTLPPVADVEGLDDLPLYGYDTIAEQRAFVSNWTQVFSNRINEVLGVRPYIYTSKSGANSLYTASVANQHELWLAWWRGTGTTQPPVVADTPLWAPWKFWQYTATGTVPGIVGDVDRDVFHGTRGQLEGKLIGDGPLGGLPGGRLTLTDFDGGAQEGYFGFAPTYSGSNSGIGSVTADRTTSQAHEGTGAQQIVVTPNAANWTLRFLSGIGAPPVSPSTPDANLELGTTGAIGFWLKTASAGVNVRVAVDDGTTGGTERGILRAVTADNQWHLYQWNLADAAQWDSWLGASNGAITNSTVTVDSILFTGNAAATIYMDTFAYFPIAGDFNADGFVDGDDLAMWESAAGPSAGLGDSDADGDSDGADFLAWQRKVTATASSTVAAAAAVPEPATLALTVIAMAIGWIGSRREWPKRTT